MNRLRKLTRRVSSLVTRPGRRDKVMRWLRRTAARQSLAARSNRARVKAELAAQAIVLESHPTTLIIDPATSCNLKCPFCPTGGGYGTLKRQLLSPETFARITDHLRPELLDEVIFYNWGEPFLNKSIFDFVRFFADHGSYTEISTNFSMKDFSDEFFNRLIDSGLIELKVSIDGASQATYEKYRVGGDFERVLRNVRRLAQLKRQRRKAYPHVTYRMLLNKHNQHDVEHAARLAAECDVDFNPDPGFWCPEDEAAEWRIGAGETAGDVSGAGESPGPAADPPSGIAGSHQPIESYCRQMWDTVVVNADGHVFPCCLIYKTEQNVGNLATQTLDEVRNSRKLRELRRFVVDPAAADPDFANHCVGCSERHCMTGGSKSPLRLDPAAAR